LEHTDACIIGGGPAGLLAAIMLAQKKSKGTTDNIPMYRNIKVLERLANPPPDPSDDELWTSDVAKFYLIGLGGRGQNALSKFGVWDHVRQYCTAVVGRRDWSPEGGGGGDNDSNDEEPISIENPGGVERIFTDRPYMTQVLPRDKLVGALYQYIQLHYKDQITVEFGKEVTPVEFEYMTDTGDEQGTSSRATVLLRVSSCEENKVGKVKSNSDESSPTAVTVTAAETQDVTCSTEDAYLLQSHFVIAADGSARTIANAMQQQDEHETSRQMRQSKQKFKVVRYDDDNRRIYKSIPLQLPPMWRHDLNYSARTKAFEMNFDALPADDKGNYCGILLLRANDPLAQPNSDPVALRTRLDENMPQFSQLICQEEVVKAAAKPPSSLPSFRYVTPRLHQGSSTVLLGDCAHTVKPYFGLGANSALEDVSILSDCLEDTAAQHQQNPQIQLKAALEEFSNRRASESKHLVQISRNLDRPGWKGALSFIIPLIMDSIFSKIMPKLFAPNAISMLQRQDITFQQGRRRKLIDRIGQLTIIGTTLSTMGWSTKKLFFMLAHVTGRRTSTITASFVGVAVALAGLQKIKPYLFQKNMEAADILAKTKGKITESETIDKR
jgi:kynurenine 3-monooxygenase